MRTLSDFATMVFFAGAICLVSRAQDAAMVPPIDFVQYVLGQDFVVEGYLLDDPSDVPASLYRSRVKVTRVLAGTVESDRLALDIPNRRDRPGVASRRGTRIIGWGIQEAGGIMGTCALVGPRDDLVVSDVRVAGGPDPILVVDGRPIEEPGTLERLRSEVERLKGQNAAEWLFSGDAIALVRVSAVNGRSASVQLVSWLVGSAERAPTVVRMAPPSGHALLLSVGEQLLIPIPASPTDTLVAPLNRMTSCGVTNGWVRALGVRMTELARVGWRDSTGMHLKPVRRGAPRTRHLRTRS